MNRGIIFSLEAAVSLLFIGTIIIAANNIEKNENVSEILLLQKENDLLKVWVKEGTSNEKEMAEDFEFVFPENSGKIVVDGKQMKIGKEGKRAVSSKAKIFSKNLEKTEIILIVFY